MVQKNVCYAVGPYSFILLLVSVISLRTLYQLQNMGYVCLPENKFTWRLEMVMFPARKPIYGGHKFSNDREVTAVVTCFLITHNRNFYDEAIEKCPAMSGATVNGGLCG
jgi:hypothetical protein